MANVGRLAAYVSGRGPAWYDAIVAGAARSRREVLRGLVADLAALGEDADIGQPPGARPPALGDHALADQLLVLAHELDASLDGASLTERLESLTAAARAEL